MHVQTHLIHFQATVTVLRHIAYYFNVHLVMLPLLTVSCTCPPFLVMSIG
jgi:hypothetical protein